MKRYHRLWLPAIAAIFLTLAVANSSEGNQNKQSIPTSVLAAPASNPYPECPPNTASIWVKCDFFCVGNPTINIPLESGYDMTDADGSGPDTATGYVNYVTGVLWQEIGPVPPAVPRFSDKTMEAMAVAARTLVYHACGVEGWGGIVGGIHRGIDDNQKQNYNPLRPVSELGGEAEKNRYVQAVSRDAGIHMTYLNDDFDVQYRNKTGSRSAPFPTATPTLPHIAVDDPVGATYDPLRNPGLAQINADHWASGSTANNAKHPAWPDYRSILAHYYSYISLVNSAGNGVAPGIRWNALTIDWYTSSTQPPILIPGGTYPVKVTVQNTGIIDLPQGQWALSYKWAKKGHTDLNSTKRVWTNATIVKGDPSYIFTFAVDDLPNWGTGPYKLKFDLFSQSAGFLSESSNWPTQDVDVCVILCVALPFIRRQ